MFVSWSGKVGCKGVQGAYEIIETATTQEYMGC